METHQWKTLPQHVRFVFFLNFPAFRSLLLKCPPVATLVMYAFGNLQICAFDWCPLKIEKW